MPHPLDAVFADILDAVCCDCWVTPGELRTRRRCRRISAARRELIVRLHVHPSQPGVEDIGRLVGLDHSTVCYHLGEARRLGRLTVAGRGS